MSEFYDHGSLPDPQENGNGRDRNPDREPVWPEHPITGPDHNRSNQETWQNGYQQQNGATAGQHAGYAYRRQSAGRDQNRETWQYQPGVGWQRGPEYGDRQEWNFTDYSGLNSNGKPPKKNRGFTVFVVALLCIVAGSVVVMSALSVYQSMTNGFAQDTPAVSERSDDEPAIPEEPDRSEASASSAAGHMEITGRPETSETSTVGGRMSIPEVCREVLPSVVGVMTYKSTSFFEPAGAGSGIIMSDDGYIITNEHVINGMDAIQVILNNGDIFDAALIGSDIRTDLAVLKIEADHLVPAIFGDSDELLVGETVIAIGNPGGTELAGSVTQGIVSAVNREIATQSYSVTYIQTDAAINPGNSGGALVNEFAQVVGINSSKIVATGYEGIGFAIPITVAKPIIDDLLQYGRVTGRVILGIQGRVITEATAMTYDVPMGLQIVEITESDMDRRGVVVGDIITHIDGERILSFDDVSRALQGRKAGDMVRLTLFRQVRITQGTTFDVDIVLIEDRGN